ncbi:MAG: B12-binding domain-containing radical SAM protein [Candidatus Bathyarchaeia archaeon]
MRLNAKVVLTAPANEMSTHHGKIFAGFGASISDPPFPIWFTRRLFYPPVKHKEGRAEFAPYALRKVEASLLANGFAEEDVHLVHPNKLEDTVTSETRAVGISVMAPLNMDPTGLTFSSIFRGEAATYIEFKNLMKLIGELGSASMKVIVGGAGAWQIHFVKDAMERYGIDTVVMGQGEKIAPELFRKAVNGEELPRVVFAHEPNDSEIPAIRRPSVCGLVEISRGCGRRCQFCLPDMRERRDFPVERIIQEVKVNHQAGCRSICLHSEDVMIYGSTAHQRFMPNREKLLKLFTSVVEATKENRSGIGMSHSSLAPIAADPKVVSEISEILEVGKNKQQPLFGYQTGIESGSVRMAKRVMAGKSLPFSPDEWPEVVDMAFGVSKDNGWIPAATLIMGLPGETADDVTATLELVDKLRDVPSFIVPHFFTPITETVLEKETIFDMTKMTDEHWQLLLKCIDHSVKWAELLRHLYFLPESWYLRLGYWIGYRMLYFFGWLGGRYASKSLGYKKAFERIQRQEKRAEAPFAFSPSR